jgi:mannose-6-phosphate isomerase-like protein (cupin superfamily)
MKGFIDNIEELTKNNTFFRQVLFTGTHSQLVLMCIRPGEDIGLEVHDSVDQFFRVDSGIGELLIDGEKTQIRDGFAIVVPAGSQHNIINTGDADLKLYTVYSPPNHTDGTIHKTRQEADAAEHHI